MPTLSLPELLILALVALMCVAPARLPGWSRLLGRLDRRASADQGEVAIDELLQGALAAAVVVGGGLVAGALARHAGLV